MSNLETLIGFRDERIAKGIPITPELKNEIARVGHKKIHDSHYRRLGFIGKLMHLWHCSEAHK